MLSFYVHLTVRYFWDKKDLLS
uniref:Uncharacterized protein n=1 Tax=Anguilla anguilla TaxID=7936 RepID=A0A0E9SJ97_ANGAN